MAQKQYDVPRGQSITGNVTASAGGAIGTSAVRVTVDDANAGTKQAAIACLEQVIDYLNTNVWPPA